jgi:alkanesulfonate monooxygenase SsuD/methylene tetrahydromethanopterin reductase-like flavin-dependent oxidoreductase (luciferase family)
MGRAQPPTCPNSPHRSLCRSTSPRSAWRRWSEPHRSPTASCRPCGPPERVTQSAVRAGHGRAQAPHLPPLDITLGLPTFIGDDLDSLRNLARQNLGLYTTFPYFQRMWRESGFGAEAGQMGKGAGPAALSDRLLDSFCLLGPVARCQERLAAYRAVGVALPILNPPIGPDAALAMIRAFSR